MFKVIPVDTSEIASFIGNIAIFNGKPVAHTHVSVADKDAIVRGGHLLELYVGPTLEVFVTVEPTALYKKLDKRYASVDDQVRRNHSIQYYSYPDYKFDRLRNESPERYESYAAMEMNKWITLRIEVKDTQAKLYLDNSKQPSLIVNDLKHGAGFSGGIGLWVEVGTESFFSDLKIQKE
ncbi:DNA-binding protein [Panacibacter ginsenosidivorans]|uniref:DNA-binding protein n=1 Tax=Panacibacter ginsenosidivorans TaxID=1813871 RepID=A0A5B8V4Q0_9BACT|nr:PPC domain-containing DNA-binding protein [Panacibacter ginsenosidivorans]QEC66360.1 DNA-binding protein [Panacibacter ginsenosidivorans]